MKNIQVIDAADNCTYDIYSCADDDFALIFVGDTDVEFIEDVFQRLGDERATALMKRLWESPVQRAVVNGIHGTLFFQLEEKKPYYPTKKQAEMRTGVEG